jgi:hypothetical protein
VDVPPGARERRVREGSPAGDLTGGPEPVPLGSRPGGPAAERAPSAREHPPSGAPAGGRRPRNAPRGAPRRRPAGGPVRRRIPGGDPVGAPGAGRESQAVQANPPGQSAGAGLGPPAAPQGAPAGPAAAGRGPRAVLERSPPSGRAAGRRGCPRQAGPLGPPDVAHSSEETLVPTRTLGPEGTPGPEETPRSEGVPVLEGTLESRATLRLEPSPPSPSVAPSHGGPPDRCRTSSRVERAAAAPLPARDRREAEADRWGDGRRSTPPAQFRTPVPERPAGTPARPASPHARAIPACARPTLPPPRPTRPGPLPTAPRARPTRPHAQEAPPRARSTGRHALRTPPRLLTRLGARSRRPRLRQGPFRVPPPGGPNLLRGAAPAPWPRPTRPPPRSPKRGRPLGHHPAHGPPPQPVEAARLPDAPIRRVARAGPRTARGRTAPRQRPTDRARSRRDRGLTSQETPREHAGQGPEPERPRWAGRPRAGPPGAWKRWSSPPRRAPATGPARAVRPVLAGLVRDALAGGWDRSSGPRMAPSCGPGRALSPAYRGEDASAKTVPNLGRSHTAGRR